MLSNPIGNGFSNSHSFSEHCCHFAVPSVLTIRLLGNNADLLAGVKLTLWQGDHPP